VSVVFFSLSLERVKKNSAYTFIVEVDRRLTFINHFEMHRYAETMTEKRTPRQTEPEI
tara:strand:+ start:1556 stop:1729 length:174 start_codon:yes stop_codon:yes gene_type:complete